VRTGVVRAPTLAIDLAERLTVLLEANVQRALPYHMVATLLDEGDLRAPREATPIFFGAFDWHSAVHSHWALVRLRRFVAAETRAHIGGVLDARITDDAAAAELAFVARRTGFELPYGLAWVLTLAAELRRAGADGARWRARLAGLETLARDRLVAWLGRIPTPIRGGEHSQSAFAASLALDWARVAGDATAVAAITDAAERLHGDDRDIPLGWEPGAHDFLSPSLGAAALIARVRTPDDFARWLDGLRRRSAAARRSRRCARSIAPTASWSTGTG